MAQQFIREHEHDDPYELSLQAHRYPDLPMSAIAEQIQARQKAKRKLPKWYATEGIVFPPPLSMEQCSSEVTAQYKQRLAYGQRLVDLTGGAGVDTYYLSQSFGRTDYVEAQAVLADIARHNFTVLGASDISVHAASAEGFLDSLFESVDCVYLDPARRDTRANKVFRLEDSQPNVTELQSTLLARATTVLLKTAPLLDIQAALRTLIHTKEVHVVAVNNEVKEVLYLMTLSPPMQPKVTAVNLRAHSAEQFSYFLHQEAGAAVTHSEPLTYLYEPNAALMKAGAFKLIAQRFNLYKLHPHTHLYTSDQPLPNFPGRCFRCRAVVPYQKKAVRKVLPEARANVATRNFPDSVATVRKKLGLQDGGDIYLFAVRLLDEKMSILITQKQ